MNFAVVSTFVGALLCLVGLLQWASLPVSLYYGGEDFKALFLSGLMSLGVGFFLWRFQGTRHEHISKREGFVIVTMAWLGMALFGSLPFLLSGTIPRFTDAFFETVSGLTTTGASILDNIPDLPRGILFWRSLTQWIGGMGIIVMAVAILPILGIGGMELFVAEAPGPTSDKIHPRIKETAKRLWGIYIALTAICCLLLWWAGMDFYDAINHSFTTMATGGYSTHQESVAWFNSPRIEYILIVFMFIAGTNYTLLYFGFKGRLERFWRNEEFKAYFTIVLVFALAIAFGLYISGHGNVEKSFRDSLFQVVSIVTTTGFVTGDYTTWAPYIVTLFFILLFVGASAGSTAGGIKIVRHVAMAKNCLLEFRRILHPRAIIPVKINNYTIPPGIIYNVLVFILIYLIIFVLGALAMTMFGLDLDSAIGASATCLGNIGPGIGSVGPAYSFNHIPEGGKWVLSALMLLGRLELFTILIVFTPYYWKSN